MLFDVNHPDGMNNLARKFEFLALNILIRLFGRLWMDGNSTCTIY